MNKSIIQEHLNNNQKVFVDLYEQHELVEITHENINSFKTVDISDESLDDETHTTTTQESRVEYYSQQFSHHNDDENKVKKFFSHIQDMKDFTTKMSLVKMYHIDCEADVYIIE